MTNIVETGYSMEEARAIIFHSPAKTVILREDDPDYPAMMELRRIQVAGVDPLVHAEMAFALGRAIGIRDERARRNGIRRIPHGDSAVEEAKQAYYAEVRNAEIRHLIGKLDETAFTSVLETMRGLAAGGDSRAAIEAGNDVLISAGRKPLEYDQIMQEIDKPKSSRI